MLDARAKTAGKDDGGDLFGRNLHKNINHGWTQMDTDKKLNAEAQRLQRMAEEFFCASRHALRLCIFPSALIRSIRGRNQTFE
jgi:hypothetical protein